MSTFVELPLNVFSDVPELLEVDDAVLSFAQEIWMCFNIQPHEHIADTGSGTLTLKQVLFNNSVNEKVLTEVIAYEIDENCAGSASYRWESSIKFIKGTAGNDIVVIDIFIYDTDETTFKQRFMFK